VSAQAGEVGALTEEVARLSAEVASLREALIPYVEHRVSADMLIGLGRCLEREEQDARQPVRRPRSQRSQHLRPVGGGL
jgi:hypothetical protein